MAQIDRGSVNAFEHERGCRSTDQGSSDHFGSRLSTSVGAERRGDAQVKDVAQQKHNGADVHGCSFEDRRIDTGAPLFLTMKTRILAGLVSLAFAETE